MGAMEPLSERARERIEALARKISVTESLDGEIQAELRGHIEDKVQGYLSGEVRVTEADALLLAEKRFGDAGVVKGMLQGVHGEAHAGSLARRLAAVFVAMVLVSIVGHVMESLWLGWVLFPAATLTSQQHWDFSTWPILLFPFCRTAVEMVLLWRLLAVWKKYEQGRGGGWFDRWHPLTLVLLGIAAVVSKLDLEAFMIGSTSGGTAWQQYVEKVVARPESLPWAFSAGMEFLPMLRMTIIALLWVWWSDRSPRTWRRLLLVSFMWVVGSQFTIYVTPIYYVVAGSVRRGQVDVSSISSWLADQSHGFFINLVWNLAAAVIAWGLYVAFKHRGGLLLAE